MHNTTPTDDVEQLRAEIARLKGRLSERDGSGDLASRLRKLEAIGAIAGTVAHDFSNLFTSILGYSSILQLKAGDDGDMARAAEVITSATRKAADLTKHLTALARKSKLLDVPVDMNDVIRDVASQLAQVAGKGVSVECRLDAKSTTVNGDPHQLRQALLHLGTNACEAVEGSGIVRLVTSNMEFDEQYLRVHPSASPGEHVAVAVTDDGPGLDEELRLRVFEPFFTTKEGSGAMGLGIPTAHGIAKNHGGTLILSQDAGRGASFSFAVPVARG